MIKSLLKYYKFSFTITITSIFLSLLMLRASFWQWERYKEKIALLATYKSNNTNIAVEFPVKDFTEENLNPIKENELVEKLLNKKVSLSGEFDFSKEVIVLNRRDATGPGYYLLAPFKIDNSSQYIIVSRGFIPFSDRLPESWKKYDKNPQAKIEAVLKKSVQQKSSFGPSNPEVGTGQPFANIWYFEEIEKMAKQLPYPVITSVLLQQLNPTNDFPKEAISIEVPPTTHFGYTFEWIFLAILTQIISFLIQCFKGKRSYQSTLTLIMFFLLSQYALATTQPEKVEQQATIRQNLDHQVDLSLEFRSQNWEQKKLADFLLDNRPTIIAPVYYNCPRLCSLTLEGLSKVINKLDLKLNSDYKILAITINPEETPESAKKKSEKFYADLKIPDQEKKGADFLTGSPENIKAVMNQLGFEYFKDGEEYAHSAGVMILTPSGKISRYFLGIDYPVKEFRYSIIEAGLGKIGSLADQIFLFCFRFDPTKGIYSLAVWRITQVICAICVIVFGTFLIKLWKKDS